VVGAAAPWPARSLVLTEARATAFHRSPTNFDVVSITRGLALYQAHCAACHGAEGNADGPLAAGLATWPPQLNGTLLWRRAEGDLLGVVMQGMRDRHGERTMPGFAQALTDAEAWSLVDGMKALAAGASLRAEGAWSEPVKAPDAFVHCDDGTPDRRLRDYRGQRVRIVARRAGRGSADLPSEDPRLVTMALEAPGRPPGGAQPAGCVIRDAEAWAAYAQVSGSATNALAGAQWIVDRDGWLRAYGRAGQAGWSLDALVCKSLRPARATPAAPARPALSTSGTTPSRADGLGDLIAAIDADPIRSTALGLAHAP
jgi:mono/diheme cytochrome c family protein